MAYPEHPTWTNGDVEIKIKPREVYVEITLRKGSPETTWRLTEQEARWLKDFLNQHYPSR